MSSRAGFSGGNTGGGSGGAEGAGLGQVIGFVTEFNQNVMIFGMLMLALDGLMNQVTDLQIKVDPEGFAADVAGANIPTTGDPYDYYDQYQQDKTTVLDKVKDSSPVYALETRLDSLESILGIEKTKDKGGKKGEQVNPLDEIRTEIDGLTPDVDDLKKDMTTAKADAAVTKDKAEVARMTAATALATALSALSKVNDITSKLYRPAQHNINTGTAVGNSNEFTQEG